MFTIINQQKKLFMSMMEAGLQESQVSSSDKQESKPEEKQSADFDSIKEKFNDAISQYKESKKPLNEGDKNAIIEAKRIAEKQIVAVTQTELKFERQKSELTNYITDEVSKLLGDINDVQTQEKISTQNDKVLGITVAEKNSRADVINSLSASSKASLAEILKTQNLSDLATQLQAARPKEKDGKESAFIYFAGVSNYGKVSEILEKAGYKTDGFFDNEEAMAVYSTILDYAANQENVKKLNDVQRFQMLIDFDQNGKLSSAPNFVVGELQSFVMAQGTLQGDKINQIMNNLGLGNMSDFSKEMSDCLFGARERFQRVLGSYMERGVKLGDLMSVGGVNKALERQAKRKQEISESLNKDPRLEEKIKSRLSAVGAEAELQTVKSAFILEAVGLSAGIANGAAASFDVREFTNAIVDSMQFGIVDGTLGVSVSKNLFQNSEFAQKNNISVTAGLLNFYIPFAKVQKDFKRKTELKKLFADKIDPKTQVSLYAGGFVGIGTFAGVLFDRPSEDNSKGIVEMTSQMREKLEAIRDGKITQMNLPIEEHAIFSEIEFELDRINSLNVTDDQKKSLTQDLINGYATYYENKLMRAAQGYKLTTIGVGLVGLAGYNWIPTLVAGGERITQEYSTVNANIGVERNTTEKTDVKIEGLDLNDTLNGKNVISLPDLGYQISSSEKTIQAERKEGKLYISGKVDSLSVNEHVTTSGGVLRTLVVNGGNTGVNDLYLASEMKGITESVTKGEKLENSQSFQNKIDSLNDNFSKTKEIRDFMFNNISDSSFSKSPDLKKLQVEIFNGSINETLNIDSAYTRLFGILRKSGFQGKVSTDLNLTDKLLILQTLPAVGMKKSALKLDSNGVVNIKSVKGENITIKNYDTQAHKREKWFDDIIRRDAGNIVSDVKDAREDWYQKVGGEKSYSFQTVNDDSIAFSATSVGKGNEGLMPYVGSYHLASVKGITEIPMNQVSESKKDKIVDKIPDTYLLELFNKLRGEDNTLFADNVQDYAQEMRHQLKTNPRLSFDLAYGKMGECLNDAIILKNIQVITETKSLTISSTVSSSVNHQSNNVVEGGLVVGKDKDGYSKDKGGANTTPDDGQTPKPGDQGDE